MSYLFKKPWIVSSILERKQPPNPSVQLLQVFDKNPAGQRHIQLSDKWNYLEALISPEAEEEANRLAGASLQASQGALFYLESYHFETDPSRRQYRLVINKLGYIGSSGSLPYHPGENIPILPANMDPKVVSSLLEQLRPEQNDTLNESEMDVSLLLDVGDSTQCTQDVHTQAEYVNGNGLKMVHEELLRETQESQREFFDDNTPQAISSESALEDMYPEQASLGGTQQVDDDEEEEEEETGAKDRERWPGDADDEIVRSSRDALADFDEGEDKPTGELGVTCDLSPLPHEDNSQTRPGSADHEDSLSFSLFHPAQQELVSEPSSIPEEGSLTFANSSVVQEDTTKGCGGELPTLSVPASQDTAYSPQQAAKSSKFWPPTGFVKWLFKQVYNTFETQEAEEIPQSPELITQINMQTQITPLRISSSSKKITEDDLLDHTMPSACGMNNDADTSVLDISTPNPASSPVLSLSSLPASGIVAAQSQSFLGVPTPNSIFKPPFESHGLSLSLSSPLIHSSHSEDLSSLSPRSSYSPRSSQSPSRSSASSSCSSFSSSLPSSSSSSSSSASVVSPSLRSPPSSQSSNTVDPLLSPASLSPMEPKKTGTKKRKREDRSVQRSGLEKGKAKGKEKTKEKEKVKAKKKSVKKRQKRKQGEEPKPRETTNSGSNPFGVKSEFFKTFRNLSWVQKKLAK